MISWVGQEKQKQTRLHQLNFCALKVTINRVKRQSMEWEKTIVNNISVQKLISIMKKELIQLNRKRTHNMTIYVKGLE